MKKHSVYGRVLFLLAILLLFLWAFGVNAAEKRKDPNDRLWKPPAAAQEFLAEQRVHRVGNIYLCMTNWGFFGSELRGQYESIGGCFNPTPEDEFQEAPSCEMPPGSDVEYLFQGGLWIGAIVERLGVVETLVTVGCDGWFYINEMAPPMEEEGQIRERSVRKNSKCYDPEAVSEQDIIAVIQDTADAPLSPSDPRTDVDNRPHRPLGIEVLQKSYSWSYDYASDFVLIEYVIRNINPMASIDSMWVALYIDADVQHISERSMSTEEAYRDDICGFLRTYTTPKGVLDVYSAWIADNNGQPSNSGYFKSRSPTGLTGVRVVSAPVGVKTYFNWWISNWSSSRRDWGPWKEENLGKWIEAKPYGGLTKFPGNVLGTPGGDISKYFVMSNKEWDYDQIFSAEDHTADGWLPPTTAGTAIDIANGFDTRYLISFGPFEKLPVGDSITFTIAYVGGENLHVDLQNRLNLPGNPAEFMRNLDFEDFALNALWTKWMYDRDFQGPPPPPPPGLEFEVKEAGSVIIRWNGKEAEEFIDPFTDINDFEGYGIYMSKAFRPDEFMLLGSYDTPGNYQIHKLNRLKMPREWELVEESVTTDSLEKVFTRPPIGDDPLVWRWNLPYVYEGSNPSDTLWFPSPWYWGKIYDSTGTWVIDSFLTQDTLFFVAPHDSLYFEKQSFNQGFDEILVYKDYRDSIDAIVDSLGDLGYDRDSVLQVKADPERYYAYQFEVRDLLPNYSYYFSVTTFDHGYPGLVSPQESDKLINAIIVYPVEKQEIVKGKGLEVVVVPNPYKLSEDYVSQFWQEGTGAFEEKINFYNLPAKCTIRIYTLDGDLVREINHDRDPDSGDATIDSWDLISRNTQKVVSGIYLFSVEDESGEVQVGKFVVIR